jgi:lipopolysaccharide transport system ATP-binding protein
MPHYAIRVAGVGKEYAIGQPGQAQGTLYDLLAAPFREPWKRRSSQSPNTRNGVTFWALHDLSFEVAPGEVVGIIGRNGAGKSTLLKILSRITAPTEGRIEVRGRLSSLLEVGTGFHPELSGRENIYLNGAILGMTRQEIARKFDEIVAFAEIAHFVDTPVKRYSSGMYVRLAFAVAAHLETDVLLVDEVLAVGDASFQRKSLGKMSEVAKGGRTVLFVSHNVGAVRNLCPRAILLDGGELRYSGPTTDALAIYEDRFDNATGKLMPVDFDGPLSGALVFEALRCVQGGATVNAIDPLQDFVIEVQGRAHRSFSAIDLNIAIYRDGTHLTSCFDTPEPNSLDEGPFASRFRICGDVFRPGRYTISIGASTSSEWILGSDVASLEFVNNPGGRAAYRVAGSVGIKCSAERVQHCQQELMPQ